MLISWCEAECAEVLRTSGEKRTKLQEVRMRNRSVEIAVRYAWVCTVSDFRALAAR